MLKQFMICCKKYPRREGIEGWVALQKLTKASKDYLKVVKDYLEYEMVQAGFERNERRSRRNG